MKTASTAILSLLLMTTGCRHRSQTNLANAITPGAEIQAVEVIGSKHSDTIRQLHTKPGLRIDVSVIKSDLETLRRLGFKDVRVEESPGAGYGKRVRFIVLEP